MVVKDIPRSIGPLPPDTETVNPEAESDEFSARSGYKILVITRLIFH